MSRLSITARLVLLLGRAADHPDRHQLLSEPRAQGRRRCAGRRGPLCRDTANGERRREILRRSEVLAHRPGGQPAQPVRGEGAATPRHGWTSSSPTLEPYDAAAVAAIRKEVDALMTRAFEAVDAYTDDRRVIGNSLMAVARVHISAVDQQLAQMVAKLRDQAARASEAAQLRVGAGRPGVVGDRRRGHSVRAGADDPDPALDRACRSAASARPWRRSRAGAPTSRSPRPVMTSSAPWRARWRSSARAWSNATAWPTSASRL